MHAGYRFEVSTTILRICLFASKQNENSGNKITFIIPSVRLAKK